MEVFSKRKYKDESPLNTINKIRNILNELGLLTIEKGWQNSAEGYYSVNLNIANTNLACNGKGTTYEYALASGYGELMERLQNQAPFRLSINLSPKALEYQGFYYAPDEKRLTMEEFLNSKDDWLQTQLARKTSEVAKVDLMKKWQKISYEDVPADFIALPFYNINTKKLSYIPIKMISKMYMSNGMCAGNTIEEAVVQGLSEVLERHVNKAIINERITPPTVPREYLKKYPRIDSMITKLEQSGNYEIIVKDCSLGKGFPVVGVIFINKNNQNYFVKFGAHPIIEIALERTLTELLQGQDIKNMLGLKEFSYKNDVDYGAENLIGILVNGSGYYPPETFSHNFSYEFAGFNDIEPSDNKELLRDIIRLLAKNGYQVYVRDVSFLGFPSYHVIVPGLSEIEEIDEIKAIDDYAEFNYVKKQIRNIDNISDKEVKNIVNFFVRSNYNSQATIVQLLNMPVNNTFPWYYMNIDLFITALYLKQSDFKNAYRFFNKYISNLQPNQYNKAVINYYKCVRDYMATRIDGLKEEDVIKLLMVFYPEDMIRQVISEFKYPESIFTKYGKMNCWDCEKCDLKSQCSNIELENVYKILKSKYAKSRIEQKDLAKILDI